MIHSLSVVTLVLISSIFSQNLYPLNFQEVGAENISIIAQENSQFIYSDSFFSIPREKFLKISEIRDAFLIKPSTSDDTLEIRMQRNPNAYSHSLVEMRDPKAKDLDGCQRIFLRMFLHPNKTASLDNLAAPSFSGRETIEIVKKLKELTNSSVVFFVDGSTQLPCNSTCMEYPLISLRPMSILKTGQSWYEKQGASSNAQILRDFFALHLEEEYLAALEEDQAFEVETPWDYDKFKRYYFAVMEMGWITPEAYNSAKTFLHTISIAEMQQTFQGVIKHPEIREAQDILESGLKLILDRGFNPKTIGEVLTLLEKFNQSTAHVEDPVHKIYHNFRDIFVSHRNSLFLSIALNTIRQRDISPMAVATMTQVLGEIPLLNLSQDESHKSQSAISYDLLLGSVEDKKSLHNLYDHYLTKRRDDVLEDRKSIAGTKVIANSTVIQQITGREYNSNRGIDNYIDALDPALEWFGSLTISDFKKITPGFFEHHQHELPNALTELSEDLTIKQFLIQLRHLTSKEKTQRFMEKMIFCLKKPFSNAAVSLIAKYQEKPEDFSPREVYVLWVIAKLIVDQYSIFGL
jgi:hypothetical protein